MQAHQESFCLALDLLSLTCYMQHSFGSSFLLWSLYCLAFSPLSGCECQRRAVLVSAMSLIEVQPNSTYGRCHFPAAFLPSPFNCCMLKISQFSVLVLQAWWESHQAHLSFMLWEAELDIAMLTARGCAGAGAGSPMSCWGSGCSGAEALKDEDKELIMCYILFEDNTFYQ